ncbi:hypothetical protein RND78_04280 [Pseudomonas oryzihabitans]|nr:hypothetical protein [Pseudomonas oryzihabitans]
MVSDREEQSLTRFGRIALSQVLCDWSESNPYNPRLLGEQVSKVIRSLGLAEHHLNTALLTAFAEGKALPDVQFTYGALADYFASSSVSSGASILDSRGQAYEPANALISRKWIDRITEEATNRASFAVGLATAAGASTVATTVNAPYPTLLQRQSTPSGSEDGFLYIGQQLGRQQGEKSAAEQLDDARIEASRLREELARERARKVTYEATLQQARHDVDEARHEAQEARRAQQKAEEVVAEHAGVIAFMDENNPLSPPEGRRIVNLWDDETEGGTRDPVYESGIGVREIVARWFKRNYPDAPDIAIKRCTWALTWPARKRGGAVSKLSKEKG